MQRIQCSTVVLKVAVSGLVLLSSFSAANAFDEQPPIVDSNFDVVIRSGRIFDGTGNPWFLGDVAIRGDRIALISRTPLGAGKVEIDATGLVVAPGFIDIHSHSDLVILEDGRAESKVRQGVTTDILGEGSSSGPYHGSTTSPRVTVNGVEHRWTRLVEYLDLFDEAGAYVREAGILRLEDAIRKMTSLNAAKAGLTDRGLLLVGKYADVTIFAAEGVTDTSTYTDPFQYSEGFEYVIVNGQIVLQKGIRTDARPGRSLRRSRD